MAVINSLRARLTFWYVVVLTSSLILFTALLYGSLARSLYRHHDTELAVATEKAQARLKGVPLAEAALDRALTTLNDGDVFVMVRDTSGELRYRSPVLQVSEPQIGRHEALVHAAAHGQSQPQFFTATLERLGIVRFICVPIETAPGGYLQIGRPLGDVAPTLATVRDASLVALPLVLALTSYGGWLLAGRALAPMKHIDNTLQAIHASDLSRRVTVKSSDGEIQQLVTTVNQTLDRLEAAFVSVREFAADASHQLQTPLAVMKSSLEFAAKNEIVAQEELIDQLSATVNEMSAILSDLQALALVDADLASARSGPSNLSETCAEAWEIVAALAEAARVSAAADIAPDVHVWGDPIKLRQVVLNLGDNAVKYTGEGGRIGLSLRQGPSDAILQVSDSGKGIQPEHLSRIFERFYRAGRHAGNPQGTGLGLAIVKRIVEVHRGRVSVSSRPGEGSTFTVTMPLVSSK